MGLFLCRKTQKIIDKFEISILTTIIKKKIFEKIKFDNRYTIIGDFDFFVRLSLIKNIKVIQEPLAYYRMHSSNLTTNKTGLYIKELENWIKEKIKNKSFKFINFSKIYLLIQVLKIKYYMSVGNNLTAFKIVFQKPFYIYKLFKFLFFFLKYRK